MDKERSDIKQARFKIAFASVQKRDLKPSLKADQRMGEALLVKWTSTSLQPFTIVEDEGLLLFAHWLNNLKSCLFYVASSLICLIECDDIFQSVSLHRLRLSLCTES